MTYTDMSVVLIAALELVRVTRMKDGLCFINEVHEELERRLKCGKVDKTEQNLLGVFTGEQHKAVISSGSNVSKY